MTDITVEKTACGVGAQTVRLAAERGLALSEGAAGAFDRYFALLTEANSRFNLTRIVGEADTAEKHFADSLSPLWLEPGALPRGARCLDIGAGAGFPSLPLAIARDDIDMTMLDSNGKKVGFLADAASSLGLRAHALQARAEELAHLPEHRARYDVVVARAVASLQVLAELALPFLRTGGILVAYKGPAAGEELSQARTALRILGAGPARMCSYTLQNGALERTLVIVPRRRPVPDAYPRRYALIQKQPL